MNVQDLLKRDSDLAQRQREMRVLKSKWSKTGLLEGLDARNQDSMAQLLENQAKQVLREANTTNTNAGGEEWAGIALPLIRRVFGEIVAQEFVSVQPMNLPSGLVFWLENKYATGQPGFVTGAGNQSQNDSIWGVTDARRGTTPGEGGLYGPGRFGYSINDYSSSAIRLVTNATGADITDGTGSITAANLTTDINFNADFSASIVDATKIKKVTIPVSRLSHPDLVGARAFTLSATGLESIFNEFTQVSTDERTITFLVSGSLSASTDTLVFYHKQPDDITRGDFEESKTQSEPLDIPSFKIEMRQEAITAKTRKLKAEWTPEFAQDINAYHNIDAEAELTALLGEYISKEIDLELLDMLMVGAQSKDYWSAKLGFEYNAGSNTFAKTNENVAAYTQGTWFQTIGTKIQKMSNTIDTLTFQGGANFIVTSPRVATILESIPGYAADTDGSKKQFNMGSQKVGMINSRFTVYKCPYMQENTLLVGYKGNSFLEAGAVYAPYVPLMMTPVIYDHDNLTPVKGIMTRYAKKMLRPEYYGKIYIDGLDTI